MRPPRQQINLYRPDAEARRGPCGADTLALATGAVLVFLLAIGGVGERRVDGLQRAVHSLQQQQEAQQQTMRALGGLLPAGASSADIGSRIRQLQVELAARERALTLLRHGAIGRTGGFSAQLAALARCPVPGLWLQRIAISGETGSMSLAGDAFEPNSVPRFLRALAGERALSGLRFYRLVIAQRLPGGSKPAKGAAAASRGVFTFSADGTPAASEQVADAQGAQP